MHLEILLKCIKKKIIKKVSTDFKLTTYILYLSQDHCAMQKEIQKCLKLYIVFIFVMKNDCPWLKPVLHVVFYSCNHRHMCGILWRLLSFCTSNSTGGRAITTAYQQNEDLT